MVIIYIVLAATLKELNCLLKFFTYGWCLLVPNLLADLSPIYWRATNHPKKRKYKTTTKAILKLIIFKLSQNLLQTGKA
jgi:hypothetical protein